MQNNVCSDIFWYGDMLLHVWAKKNENLKILYKKYNEKRWGDDIINQLTHLHIHIDCSRNVKWW